MFLMDNARTNTLSVFSVMLFDCWIPLFGLFLPVEEHQIELNEMHVHVDSFLVDMENPYCKDGIDAFYPYASHPCAALTQKCSGISAGILGIGFVPFRLGTSLTPPFGSMLLGFGNSSVAWAFGCKTYNICPLYSTETGSGVRGTVGSANVDGETAMGTGTGGDSNVTPGNDETLACFIAFLSASKRAVFAVYLAIIQRNTWPLNRDGR